MPSLIFFDFFPTGASCRVDFDKRFMGYFLEAWRWLASREKEIQFRTCILGPKVAFHVSKRIKFEKVYFVYIVHYLILS